MGIALAPPLETRSEQKRRLPSPIGGGRYEFERLIGEGRHKRVYLATDRHADREVGLALRLRAVAGQRRTPPGAGDSIEGTAAYIAPEQALGAPADQRSDLYSLGALLYELLCAQPPFVADDPDATLMAHLHKLPAGPSRRRADVPRELDELVLSLLEKAPEHRPGTAAGVIDALAAIRPLSPPVGLVRRLGRKGRARTVRRVAA